MCQRRGRLGRIDREWIGRLGPGVGCRGDDTAAPAQVQRVFISSKDYDVKGEVVFADRFELLGGARGPTYTETGGTLPTVVNGQAQTYSMFTGTTMSGRYDADHGNCNDWSNADKAIIMAPPPSSKPFSECIASSCSGVYCSTIRAHIYCFEIR